MHPSQRHGHSVSHALHAVPEVQLVFLERQGPGAVHCVCGRLLMPVPRHERQTGLGAGRAQSAILAGVFQTQGCVP